MPNELGVFLGDRVSVEPGVGAEPVAGTGHADHKLARPTVRPPPYRHHQAHGHRVARPSRQLLFVLA